MRIAWLFPGQGAQRVGMGQAVADGSPAARNAFAQVDEAVGTPISRLCFEGPADTLTLTANTQPALLATSCAILAALREQLPHLPEPVCAAGHSLGEYGALVAAGALALPAAARLCRARGLAMQEAVPVGRGAMNAIVGLDGPAVAALCAEVEGVVSPANFNGPQQTVVAGEAAAVARVGDLAEQQGARAIALDVSAPFHCALMAPVGDRMATALAGEQIEPPRFPVIANVDAKPKAEPAAISDALVRQVDQPVQWVRTIEHIRQMGVTHALEIGPGRVLSGLARRIDRKLKMLSVDGPSGIEKVPNFIELKANT